MQINGVIAHSRIMSSIPLDVDVHVIPDLGGANIMATTVLTHVRNRDTNFKDFVGQAFFSQYTDSTGEVHLFEPEQPVVLFLNGVLSLSVVTVASNAIVESLTTVWLLE